MAVGKNKKLKNKGKKGAKKYGVLSLFRFFQSFALFATNYFFLAFSRLSLSCLFLCSFSEFVQDRALQQKGVVRRHRPWRLQEQNDRQDLLQQDHRQEYAFFPLQREILYGFVTFFLKWI